MTRTPLPDRRYQETRDVRLGERRFQISVGYDNEWRPMEAFATGPREGSDMQAIVADACVLISIALQHGIAPDALGKSLGRVPAFHGGQEHEAPASVIGLIVEALVPPTLMEAPS